MTLSSLCQRCGLCCDGTLFARVPLTPTEAKRLQVLGIHTATREDGSDVLPQRCGALEGRRCCAYEARPQTCRSYVCQLGTALVEGEVGLEEALSVVMGAHERMAALSRACFDDEELVTLSDRLRTCVGSDDPRLQRPEVREAFAELERFLDRHFRGRARGR